MFLQSSNFSKLLLMGVVLGFMQFKVNAAEFSLTVTDKSGKAVPNAVVYLEPSNPENLDLPVKEEIVDQVNKKFLPEIKVITRGSILNFPNKDDINHHVYSFSEAKQFELPLYQGQTAKPVEFDKAGVVSLGCNIHDWMKGYVVVVDTPFYTKTDVQGVANFTNLPSDKYTVNTWHPNIRQEMASSQIDLLATTEQTQNVSLELKSSVKKRRSPRGRGSRY